MRNEAAGFESLAPECLHELRERPMKKNPPNPSDELRPAYDLTTLLKSGVKGKHVKQYSEGTNLVLLEPEIHSEFKTNREVNDALRLVIELRKIGATRRYSARRSIGETTTAKIRSDEVSRAIRARRRWRFCGYLPEPARLCLPGQDASRGDHEHPRSHGRLLGEPEEAWGPRSTQHPGGCDRGLCLMKLPVISGRQAVAAFRKLGYELDEQHGSHMGS